MNKLYMKMNKTIINNNFEKFIKLLPSISYMDFKYVTQLIFIIFYKNYLI
jgi:hypothetical protein